MLKDQLHPPESSPPDRGPRPVQGGLARRSPPRRKRRRRRWLRRFVATVVAAAVIVGGGLVALLALTPSVADAPQRARAILAAHHTPSDNGVVPRRVAAALLATEDSRFYSDPALDARGLARAGWGLVTARNDEGGATIEVQLAKLLYTPARSGPGAELEQVGIAIKLDQRYSKHTILAMYLDAAYFGDGAYGVTAAAHRYFGLPPGRLSWAQASLIAGLVQAPSAYDPHLHFSLAIERRRHVLSRLVAVHVLTAARARRIERQPLHPAVSFGG